MPCNERGISVNQEIDKTALCKCGHSATAHHDYTKHCVLAKCLCEQFTKGKEKPEGD
jgi:hypothetical protein